MSRFCYSQSGKSIELGGEIGRGGEGTIYEVVHNPSQCGKIYSKPISSEHLKKLSAMIAAPPVDPTIAQRKHYSIAWPQDLLFEDPQGRRCLGLLMPRIDVKAFRKVLSYIDSEERVRNVGGGFNWKYLHTTALNIASSVSAIHEREHRIGDLNESNILVAPNALISIIDCDSFQVRNPTTRQIYRCPVGKPEYTAPELQGAHYGEVDRTSASDLFALAVLFFQLLMEGTHPYQARGEAVEDAPSTQLKIVKGLFPYVKRPRGVSPPVFAPPFEILDPAVQKLFLLCFVDGHRDPSRRPTALEWLEALRRCEKKFQACNVNSNHLYFPHLRHCPWCERAKGIGRDPFPPSLGRQVALDDPTQNLASLEDRRAFLRSFVEIALTDGVVTPQEREHLINRGLALQFKRQEIEALIDDEIKEAGGAHSAVGLPILAVDTMEFHLQNLAQNTQNSHGFTLSNQGGGTLSGSLTPSRSWIRCPSAIDTSKHIQKIQFHVDTSGLALGFSETGEIWIDSNGGRQRILVSMSVELPEAALKRFKPRLAASGAALGLLCGLAVFGATHSAEQTKTALALSALCLTVGAFLARPALGCLTLVGGLAWMSLSQFPEISDLTAGYVPSAVAWAILFASGAYFTAKWTFKVRARGSRVPYPFLLGCLLQTLLVLGLLGVQGSSAAKIAVQQPALYRIEVMGDLVNVRAEPSTNGHILQKVPKGTVLDVESDSGEWKQVRLSSGSAPSLGWIHRKFVQKLGETAPAASTVTPAPSSTVASSGLSPEFKADQAANRPPIPYKDEGACPFEGCVYRDWTTMHETPALTSPDGGSPISFVAKEGDIVHAETGFVATLRSGQAKVMREVAIGKKRVSPGQIVYVLHYDGEGFFSVWFEGEEDSLYVASNKEQDEEAALVMTEKPDTVWWVQLQNAEGQIGWTNQPDNFGNKDQLGLLQPVPGSQEHSLKSNQNQRVNLSSSKVSAERPSATAVLLGAVGSP